MNAMCLNDSILALHQRCTELDHSNQPSFAREAGSLDEPTEDKMTREKTMDASQTPGAALAFLLEMAQGLAESYAARERLERTGRLHRV